MFRKLRTFFDLFVMHLLAVLFVDLLLDLGIGHWLYHRLIELVAFVSAVV